MMKWIKPSFQMLDAQNTRDVTIEDKIYKGSDGPENGPMQDGNPIDYGGGLLSN